MRVEWQDFVISSQLLCILIEGKIKAIQLVNACVIVQTVLLSFVICFSFYFLNALQSDNNSNRVYVLGHKYVLGPSQTHFSPRLAARAKMSLSGAQNIFMPANTNSIVILMNARANAAKQNRQHYEATCQFIPA